jgi:hypothetical protein
MLYRYVISLRYTRLSEKFEGDEYFCKLLVLDTFQLIVSGKFLSQFTDYLYEIMHDLRARESTK